MFFTDFVHVWIYFLTSLPSSTPISWATRCATVMAATRRGWVIAMRPLPKTCTNDIRNYSILL